jgi:hypothetical protein
MKATFNIPDELYREIKARSALEGRPVRDVVITLFRQWLGQRNSEAPVQETDWMRFEPPLSHLVPDDVADHSIEAIRKSIVENFDETV